VTDADPLQALLDDVAARERFTGVVRVDLAGRTLVARAYGDAHRGLGVPNTVDTTFATASGAKSFTALAVLSLVEDGTLALDTPVRRWLRDDLPLVAGDVTVGHLLAHRGGIGDYLDEEALDDASDYVLEVPVHRLATAEDYLAVLDGHPTVFPAGERFAYNNGGYVVLALVAQRASGVDYHDLVTERVLRPAGMTRTTFPRSDSLPGDTAVGYIGPPDDLRTNVLHLPLRVLGNGGAATTVADVAAFWAALHAGRLVGPATLADATTEHGREDGETRYAYGLGFWLEQAGDGVMLEGSDPGISFRSLHRPSSGLTWTVASNWTDGAWPVTKALAEAFPPA
jgi:CubicO group peptidase (beta-lactamase class C family)